MTQAILPEASAHGRFQPLHNGHMEYLLEAKRRCRFLWVGITAVDPIAAQRARGTAREQPWNNPLSYFERVVIIRGALIDAGLLPSEFACVPFPIEFPETLSNYVPTALPCLTTICEEWNRQKIRLLESLGYSVTVLYERSSKEISGHQIRESVQAGLNSWETKVPPATVEAVKLLNLRGRLLTLKR